MPIELIGLYAYTIQGLMHAQNIDDQTYEINLADPKTNTTLPLEVNQAGADLAAGTNGADADRLRQAVEMPVMTAFYSLNYPFPPKPPPVRVTPDPNFSATSSFPEGYQAPSLPGRTQTTPDIGFAYTPNTGYYPFSEAGYMRFTPDFALINSASGGVTGRRRVNTAGYSGLGRFTGRYVFDSDRQRNTFALDPTGIITTQFTPKKLTDLVWDYAFVMVSSDELLLSANSRVPRPAVATGTMKKIKF